MRKPQRGVALITAMLVVAIAVLASTALLTSGHLAMRRMESLQGTEQAWWVVRGVEAWLLAILQQDSNGYDALSEDELWSQPVDYLPVEQGYLRGRIVDQQSMFNLNNLRSADADDPYARQFRRLLKLVEEQSEFESGVPDLVPAIVDWLDADGNPGFPGAEDPDYLQLEPPYRAANRLFESVSELRAVAGVTPEIYRALVTGCAAFEGAPPQSCIAALPTRKPSKVNVNTASRNVLMALSDSTDEGKLDAFLGERKENPSRSTADFKKREIYGRAKTDEKVDDKWDVRTEYFQIRGEVVVGTSRLPLYSLIRRALPGAGRPAGGSTYPTIIAHGTAED